MKWLLCELILSCSLSAAPMALDELTYRTILYDYYQERYDDALVGTLVAEAQQRTGEDTARFQLARGSFAFKDGMYRYARETFDAVGEEELTDIERLRLAFHLARVHHQREDWVALSRELANIRALEPTLEEPLRHPEVNFMRVELALAEQNVPAARQALSELPEKDPLRPYALYNLAVLLRESGDRSGARDAFRALAEGRAVSADTYDLVQRAKLALAYMARQDEALGEAGEIVESLPADGRYRDVALATYGNIAMQDADNELAARIWLTLKQDEQWTASAAAARIGLPMSLEALAEPQTVLMHYQSAERGFESRLVVLEGLVQRTEDMTWVRNLAATFARAEDEDEPFADMLGVWEKDIGHREWVEWLADEQAHKLLSQWRQLDGMKRYLAAVPEKLESFAEVAQEQQRRAGAAKQLLETDGLLARREEMAASIGRLASALDVLAQAEGERTRDWYWALADHEERQLLEQLWEMQDGFAGTLDGEAASSLNARVERLLGTVYYTLSASYAERHWSLTKRTQQLEGGLLDLDERIARVQAAEAHFVAGVAQNFDAYASRASQLIASVDEALVHRETALAGLLRGRLQNEKDRVQQYLFVARVAIARATDQLALSTIEGDTP